MSLSSELEAFAQRYLKRALTEEEREILRQQFQQPQPAPPAQPRKPDTDRILEEIKASAENALNAQKRVEESILETVQSANSLADLRPGNLRPGGDGASQLVMQQIADRLANLVKQEVRETFETQFGGLRRQLEAAINALENMQHDNAPMTNAAQPAGDDQTIPAGNS